MNAQLRTSYLRCQQAARRAASNFYPCLRVLPPPKRRAMYALYAYFRRTDDITDDEVPARPAASRRVELASWRDMLEATLAGENRHEFSLALHDAVTRYEIPPQYLFAALDGAGSDLENETYQTLDDLLAYCYQVASSVGLACIHVWGFSDQRAIEPATRCGYAFQLTNILRDLKEDAARGRIYLPHEDLQRFGYSAEELRRGVVDQRYRQLLDCQIDRTAAYFEQARELEDYLHADGRKIYRVMRSAYGCLLEEIRRLRGDVFSRRVSLPLSARLRLAAGIWLSPALLPRPHLALGRQSVRPPHMHTRQPGQRARH